jgi:hypothetical protein
LTGAVHLRAFDKDRILNRFNAAGQVAAPPENWSPGPEITFFRESRGRRPAVDYKIVWRFSGARPVITGHAFLEADPPSSTLKLFLEFSSGFP